MFIVMLDVHLFAMIHLCTVAKILYAYFGYNGWVYHVLASSCAVHLFCDHALGLSQAFFNELLKYRNQCLQSVFQR